MKTVAESMKSIEAKKRSLETQVDSLNDQLASVKAQGMKTSQTLSDSSCHSLTHSLTALLPNTILVFALLQNLQLT